MGVGPVVHGLPPVQDVENALTKIGDLNEKLRVSDASSGCSSDDERLSVEISSQIAMLESVVEVCHNAPKPPQGVLTLQEQITRAQEKYEPLGFAEMPGVLEEVGVCMCRAMGVLSQLVRDVPTGNGYFHILLRDAVIDTHAYAEGVLPITRQVVLDMSLWMKDLANITTGKQERTLHILNKTIKQVLKGRRLVEVCQKIHFTLGSKFEQKKIDTQKGLKEQGNVEIKLGHLKGTEELYAIKFEHIRALSESTRRAAKDALLRAQKAMTERRASDLQSHGGFSSTFSASSLWRTHEHDRAQHAFQDACTQAVKDAKVTEQLAAKRQGIQTEISGLEKEKQIAIAVSTAMPEMFNDYERSLARFAACLGLIALHLESVRRRIAHVEEATGDGAVAEEFALEMLVQDATDAHICCGYFTTYTSFAQSTLKSLPSTTAEESKEVDAWLFKHPKGEKVNYLQQLDDLFRDEEGSVCPDLANQIHIQLRNFMQGAMA